MTVKIRVKNFQSIKDSSIEVDGLTVITGANNSGKSALVRAIRGVVENLPSRSLVRSGEKSLQVTLEFPDHTVVWEKGKGVNQYLVDGVPMVNVGSGVPEEVKTLGVHSIQIGSHEIWPQIASQFDGALFLTNKPGSVLAEAISDVERVGTLNRALKSSESDQREKRNRIKLRKQDLVSTHIDLLSFEGFEEASASVEGIETLIVATGTLLRALKWAQSMSGSLQETRLSIQALSQAITSVPDLDATDLRIKKVERATIIIEELIKMEPEILSLREALSLSSEVDVLQDWSEEDVEQARDQGTQIEEHMQLSQKLQDINSTTTLLTAEAEKAHQEWGDVNNMIQELLGDLSECPVCGTAHVHPEPK